MNSRMIVATAALVVLGFCMSVEAAENRFLPGDYEIFNEAVIAGDTWWKYRKQYELTYYQMAQLNGLTTIDLEAGSGLYEGHMITLARKKAEPTPQAPTTPEPLKETPETRIPSLQTIATPEPPQEAPEARIPTPRMPAIPEPLQETPETRIPLPPQTTATSEPPQNVPETKISASLPLLTSEAHYSQLSYATVSLAAITAALSAGILTLLLLRRPERKFLRKALADAAPKNADASAPSNDAIERSKNAILDGILAFQKTIDKKDAQIKRYQEGYDLTIFKRFLKQFIYADLALRAAHQRGKFTEEDADDIRAFLEDAFEECGITRFEPEVGILYREAEGVKGNPKTVPTDDAKQNGTIAEVVEPGYVAENSANRERIIIYPAKVRIYQTS